MILAVGAAAVGCLHHVHDAAAHRRAYRALVDAAGRSGARLCGGDGDRIVFVAEDALVLLEAAGVLPEDASVCLGYGPGEVEDALAWGPEAATVRRVLYGLQPGDRVATEGWIAAVGAPPEGVGWSRGGTAREEAIGAVLFDLVDFRRGKQT